MHHVYILRSKLDPDRIYKGLTSDLSDRLSRHNRGEISHTSKFLPWEMIFSASFETRELAAGFEAYLKSGSGIAFMRKRLIIPPL